MKPLVVLLLTGTLIWAFLKLYPASPEQEAQAGQASGLRQEAPGPTAPRQHTPIADPQPASARASERATARADDLFAPQDVFDDKPVDAAEGPEARRLGLLLSQERLDEARALAAREASALPGWAPEAIQAFALGLGGGELDAARTAATRAHDAGLAAGPGLDLLRAALRAGPLPAPERRAATNPIELGMELALHLQAGRRAVEQEDWAAAEEHYSAALLGELDAPWPSDPEVLRRWSDEINAFQRRHRWSRSGVWPHEEMRVEPGDSLISLRKRYLEAHPGAIMCTGLIAESNGLKETIYPGDTLRVPTEPVEVLTDVSSRWLVYTLGGKVAYATEVGVGREGEETLEGIFEVGIKREDPPYWPRGQEMIPFGSPENPLGTRWMGWRFPGQSESTSYGYHGTWEPESIGQAASEGCVRLLNEDVEFLFEILPEGARNVVRP